MTDLTDITSRIEKFPIYKRSPRLVLEPPTEAIVIRKPTAKASISKNSLIQIIVTPLIMLAVTVGIGILLKRGMYMMMGVAGTSVTAVFSIYRYISERRECVYKNKRRGEKYEKYLLDKRKKIYAERRREQQCYAYSAPKLVEIVKMVDRFDNRIYERVNSDADFLMLTVGYTTGAASAPIDYTYDELQTVDDELENEALELAEEYRYTSNIPVTVNLQRSHMGMVGEKDIVHEQLHLLLAKLLPMVSYHDLEVILLISSNDKAEFDYMRWYPHMHIEAIGATGIIDNEAMGEQILLSLHKIIKERELMLGDQGRSGIFTPYFLFVIDNNKLIADHVIMEYLGKNETYGFSIIYTSNMLENLPENIGTIVRYESYDKGQLVLNEKKVVKVSFELDRIGNCDLEWLARDISILRHEQGLVMHLPDSVSFFDMYKVTGPAMLDIRSRWNTNNSNKSLAVPLGIRVTGEPLMLNLHEKAHGPHGLIAGTTGSGKSEIIQSYILSLAVNFHPYEVGFLLIDYKGGGMAHLFEKLPHVLGTITNLDADESMRALASIRSELARRQRIFMEHDVNNISAYTVLFRNGEAVEPLPHLFIISDEFAELKKEQPEFMTELVSTARLGRSLGIHLILATQKPSGVVTDQIWSNSRFKLALKVADVQDSKEIIKTADAAYIRNPGRAYLQVGNNEIYELFQSAYSGAECRIDTGEELIDDRIYLRNFMGQMELIGYEGVDEADNEIHTRTQLDMTVDYISKLYIEMGIKDVARPWLPSLDERMTSPRFIDHRFDDMSNIEELNTGVALGVLDKPYEQSKEEYLYDLLEDGNLVVYGAPGYGKSVLLTTLIMSLASINSAEYIRFYILDLGNGSLLPLKKLPHTADYMNFDENEKLDRFMQMIQDEQKRRKRLLAESSSISIDMYNRTHDKKLPIIVWTIDNYDIVKEMNEGLDGFVTAISRDGISVGIYVFLTCSRPGVLRFALANNFKSRIALYMYDKNDISAVVGKPEYGIKDIKGRGFVKLDRAVELQVYTVTDIGHEETYVSEVKKLVDEIDKAYNGMRPDKIHVMPRTLTRDLLTEYMDDKQVKNNIPIGLRFDNLEIGYLNLNKGIQLIIGASGSGRTTLLKTLIEMSRSAYKIYILDDKSGELAGVYEENRVTYIGSLEEFYSALTDIKSTMEERKRMYEENKKLEGKVSPRSFYNCMEPILFIVAELEDITDYLKTAGDSAMNLMVNMIEYNIVPIVSANANRIKGIDPFTRLVKEVNQGIVTGSFSSQTLFNNTGSRIVADNSPGIGYIFERGKVDKIRIAGE